MAWCLLRRSSKQIQARMRYTCVWCADVHLCMSMCLACVYVYVHVCMVSVCVYVLVSSPKTLMRAGECVCTLCLCLSSCHLLHVAACKLTCSRCTCAVIGL